MNLHFAIKVSHFITIIVELLKFLQDIYKLAQNNLTKFAFETFFYNFLFFF